MSKNKMVILFSVMIICLFVHTIVFGAKDEKGNYYITDGTWSDGKVLKWEITIQEITLLKDDGVTEVTIIGTSVTKDITQADADQIAQYYAQSVSLPAGTYTRLGLTLGSTSILRGYIQIPAGEANAGKYYATGQGTTLYDNASAAEAAATDITVSAGGGGEKEWLPDEGGTTITIEEGKSYTFKILFSICGLEPNDDTPPVNEGVGLTWDGDSFIEGMMQDKYYLIDQDGNIQEL